ncbi:hypothetical protein DICPUDRAFT_151633 [Dictyostelium purpureum]|uniref:GAF domain-containing protein n=1 Tax=Dictyostelium purpureum TaxID=5786 RepID=F0ZJC5_DICPU|nr:uncharacterized protein DICPUDRAFT_151633 [Dictyostelium purpureum]EGC35954.1 hypothetical protein DICPUDRAFT_151633 [Dictyostelium purpureum]|eukprot:XP_003287527.1 hypothetical protein DICPUDRAFT_151633 [Dictyostelium purpureum]
MDLREYIKVTELDKQLPISEEDIKEIEKEDISWLEEIFKSLPPSTVDDDQFNKYYNFTVPKLGEGGSCSLKTEFEPFDLTSILGERTTESDLQLWRLNQVIEKLQSISNVDWLGIYKKINYKNSENNKEDGLLKLAYYGEFSRAIFPLTDYFQTISNNSWVGINGKSKVIQSLSTYEGVYYNCSDKVKSEICIPILLNNNVVGIIDAESWKDNHFSSKILLKIVLVSLFISKHL